MYVYMYMYSLQTSKIWSTDMCMLFRAGWYAESSCMLLCKSSDSFYTILQ